MLKLSPKSFIYVEEMTDYSYGYLKTKYSVIIGNINFPEYKKRIDFRYSEKKARQFAFVLERLQEENKSFISIDDEKLLKLLNEYSRKKICSVILEDFIESTRAANL